MILSVPLLFGLCVSLNVYKLSTRSDCYPWPAVTRCQVCENRIYVWQSHERRESGANVKKNPNVVKREDGKFQTGFRWMCQ